MKIISIVGTRPQLIKIASISRKISSIIINTGQHYDKEMNDDLIKEFDLDIKYSLNTHTVAEMIVAIEPILLNEKPDLVIVMGDTFSTLAGVISAKKCGIKLVHIESGLRSYRNDMPEEINRVVADHLSDILFCPNQNAHDNLQKEGLKSYIVGDPLIDLVESIDIPDRPKDYCLLTIHRRDKDKRKIKKILKEVAKIGKVIWPMHPRIKKLNLYIPNNITVIEPQGYHKTLELIKNAKKVITDSGGIQRESYLLNTPTIILRDETEWPELLNESNILAANYDLILSNLPSCNNKKILFGVGNKIKEVLNEKTS